MLILGIQITSERSRRVVRGVVLNAADDSVVDELAHLTDPQHDEATQTREARDYLASALRAHALSAAVLLEADHSPGGVSRPVKNRLRIEGACLSVIRDATDRVEVMNGPALGRACGGTKDEALVLGDGLGLPKEFRGASAAALAAKSICP